jgi:hypothetical protein
VYKKGIEAFNRLFNLIVCNLEFGISRQSRYFGSGLSGLSLFADKNNGKSCMKKNKKNSHREPGGHRVNKIYISVISVTSVAKEKEV